VSAISSRLVDSGFHARFSAKGTRDIYRILNRRLPSALLRDRAWHVPLELDAGFMSRAASVLVGEHDFRAFMASGSPVNSTVRHVWGIDVVKGEPALGCGGDEILIHVSGNGFLYNMVRIIAGTLVGIGLGRLPADGVTKMLTGLDRKEAGQTAPPHGLYLAEVFY
jgi:tRNA pseudouridine38-40 synthase